MKKFIILLSLLVCTSVSLFAAESTIDISHVNTNKMNLIQAQFGYSLIKFKVSKVFQNVKYKEKRELSGLSLNLGYNRIISKGDNIELFTDFGFVLPVSSKAVVSDYEVNKFLDNPEKKYFTFGLTGRVGINKVFKLTDRIDIAVGTGIFTSNIFSNKRFNYSGGTIQTKGYNYFSYGFTFNIQGRFLLSNSFILTVSLKPSASIFSAYNEYVVTRVPGDVSRNSDHDITWDLGFTGVAGIGVAIQL